MKQKPLILVTNDDGISAPGIRALIGAVKPLGDLVVVAPDKPQSGMAHAITLSTTLRVNKVTIEENGVEEYSTTGTPVDCVKLALKKILPRTPDIIVSGINHGYNSSISVIYSGTMSAAIEGALEGIPSIGFSLGEYSIDADFRAAAKVARIITENALKNKFPENVCLNVNIPPIKYNELCGIKVCRQAKANWDESFDERKDPYGRTYYWLTGSMINFDKGKDTDEWALKNNYVSVVPVQLDLTAYKALPVVENWHNNLSLFGKKGKKKQ